MSAVIVLALLYEPSRRLFFPKLGFFGSMVIVCVATARSKGGVPADIGAILLSRLIVGVALGAFK